MASVSSLQQESLCSLLLWDFEYGGKVSSLVPLSSWDGLYKRIATKASEYWSNYKAPPADHALDLFDQLEQADPKQKEQLRALWDSLNENRAGINAKYVLGQVSAFLREQHLRTGIIQSVELLESGDLLGAEAAIQKGLSGVLDVFDPGLLFHKINVAKILAASPQSIPTGIKLLDQKGLGPTPGELHLFIAPPGYGKSWWLIHLAKMALANRKRVVYVTLELSELRVASRLLQSFFAVAKRRERLVNKVFEENEMGQLIRIEEREIKRMNAFDDENIEIVLQKKLEGFGHRSPLAIRQFPTGALTVRELTGYLNNLEISERLVPDLLLVDYADLMSLSSRDYRHELGNLYKDLRGIAVSRNIAVATASQSGRDSVSEKTITGRNVAEDWSKIATCDCVLTYNRTDAEKNIQTARLWVDKGRNDTDKFSVLISQNYATGQFCLSSARMSNRKYWELVNERREDRVSNEEKPKKRERL